MLSLHLLNTTVMSTNQDPKTGNKKRARIPYTPPNIVLSSSQFEAEEPEPLTSDADVTEEDLLLLGDPDQDQDGGADEFIGEDQYLDDTDFDGDLLNEGSGRRSGSGSDLDMPEEDLDNAGSAMQQEDEENDYFGHIDEETDGDDEAKELF